MDTVLDRSRSGRRAAVVRLRRERGLSEHEIGDVLGITHRAVRRHLSEDRASEDRTAEMLRHSWPYVVRAKQAEAEFRRRAAARKYGHDPAHPDRLPR